MFKEDNNILYYKSDSITLNQPFNLTSLNKIMQPQLLNQLSQDDIKKIQALLPENTKIANPNDIISILTSKQKMESPIELFGKMYQKGFFTKTYQSNRKAYENDCLQTYISQHKLTLHSLTKYQKAYECNELSEQNQFTLNHTVSFDMHSELASSGYSSVDSDKEDGQLSMNNDNNQLDDGKSSDNDRNLSEFGISSNERFRGLKKNKNQITIKRRTPEEKKDFQKQETERYKSPHLPWEYTFENGIKAVVAPLLKKMKANQQTSKPREHALLKAERPSYITILSLVRDAAARLTDGVGTRADICDLLKDSQYINEHLLDSQLNNIVSGALDRLHYEKDPCVKYDQHRKLWIYLHRNRTVDFPYWSEQLKKGMNDEETEEQNVEIKDNTIKDLDMSNSITIQLKETKVGNSSKKKEYLSKKRVAGKSLNYTKPKKKHKY